MQLQFCGSEADEVCRLCIALATAGYTHFGRVHMRTTKATAVLYLVLLEVPGARVLYGNSYSPLFRSPGGSRRKDQLSIGHTRLRHDTDGRKAKRLKAPLEQRNSSTVSVRGGTFLS